jgi:AbrB family looped-hinge helix DNA binding protein
MGRFEAKTSMKGQATIPVEVRKALGLPPGGSVQFIVNDDGKVSVVAKKRGLSHVRGMFGRSSDKLNVDQAVQETVALRNDPGRVEDDP